MTLDEIATELTPKVTISYNGRAVEAVRAGTQWNDIEKVKEQLGMLATSRDFIAKAADFPAGSEPKPKDIIVDGGVTWKVYQLAGEECWRPLGNESSGLIRIHCKK